MKNKVKKVEVKKKEHSSKTLPIQIGTVMYS